MDQFDNMISSAENQMQQAKVKNFTTGTDKKRWADVLTTFFQSEGVSSRRDAPSASNIDAVENVSTNPTEFLALLQRVSPQPFTWGEQTTNEQAVDQFTDIIQEMSPVGDEDRADLKRMLGRQIPDHEIEMLVSNSTQLIELIQQSFPEYNIQLEGVFDTIKNRMTRSSPVKAVKSLGNVARGLGALSRGKKSDKNPYGLDNDEFQSNISAGKEGVKSAARGAKQIAAGSMKGAKVVGNLLYGPRGEALRNIKQMKQVDKGNEQLELDRFWDEKGYSKDEKGLLTALAEYPGGVDADKREKILKMFKKGDLDLNNLQKLQTIINLENNLKMKTFEQIIRDTGMPIMEAPEDEAPPAEVPAEPEQAAVEPPVDDTMEFEPDDVDKLQIDMLELVRQALIINPNDIDSVSYSKLTTKVSASNVRELKTLLNKLVRDHYPDLEMHDIDPGPGVS